MPTVRRYGDNQVALARTTDAKFRAADNNGGVLGAVGEGMQRLGRAGAYAAEQQDRVDALYDEARAKEDDNAFTAQMREWLHTGEDAYFAQKGKNALLARPDLERRIEEAKAEYLARAQTDRQRAMLEQVMSRRVNAALLDIGTHAARETEAYERQQSSARIEEATQDAVQRRNDPAMLNASIATIESEILDRAEKEGWDGDYTQGMIQKARGAVHASIVRAISIDDPRAAMDWLDAHHAEIADPDTLYSLRSQLAGPVLEQWADEESDVLLGVLTPGQVDEDGAPLVELGAPVEGQRTSAFGYRTDPITGERKFHKGQDIAAPEGSPVGSAATGTVVFAGAKGGYGNYVVVDHGGGRRTAYAHLAGFNVSVGDKVSRGQQIGRVGSTGRSTGPHLHFELYVDGEAVNPEGGGRVAVSGDDLEAQIAAVKAGGYSYQQEKALIAALTRKNSQRRSFQAQREADAYDDVTRTMNELGDNLTSTAQLGTAYIRLSPQQQSTVLNVIEANRKPEPVKTDLPTYWALQQIQALEPRRFTALDPWQYRSKLSEGDFRQLIRDQAEVIGKDGNLTPKAVARKRLFDVAKDAMQAAGIETGNDKAGRDEENVARRLEFIDDMQSFADSWAQENPGKTPGDADIRRWAGTLLMRANEDSPALFEMNGQQLLDSMADRDRAQIERALRANGQPVTPSNIVAVYRDTLIYGRFRGN